MPPEIVLFDAPLMVDHSCGGLFLTNRRPVSMRTFSMSGTNCIGVGVRIIWGQRWWRCRRSRGHRQAGIRVVMSCGVHPPRGNRDYVLKFIPPHRAIYLTHRANSNHIAVRKGHNVLI